MRFTSRLLGVTKVVNKSRLARSLPIPKVCTELCRLWSHLHNLRSSRDLLCFIILDAMKSLVLFGFLVSVTIAQRPSFAGSSAKGYPELASRFRETESSPTTTSIIVNRVGEDVSTTTAKIPVDARGDQELVKRLEEWPRENRPFWLLNAAHIEQHRNPQGSVNQDPQVLSRSGVVADDRGKVRSATPVPRRSTFLGAPKTR